MVAGPSARTARGIAQCNLLTSDLGPRERGKIQMSHRAFDSIAIDAWGSCVRKTISTMVNVNRPNGSIPSTGTHYRLNRIINI
jgi:hypothetical protein